MATEDRWHDFAKEKPSEDMEGRDFIVSNGYSDTLSMWCGGYWENEPFMGNRLCDEVVRWKGYLTPEEEKANEATRKELLAEKDKEIEELKAKLEDAKAEAAKANEEKATAEKAKEEAESKLPEWKKKEIPENERLFPEDLQERKRKFNREALEKIVELTLGDEGMAKSIITAIVKGQVPHIYMDYELDK